MIPPRSNSFANSIQYPSVRLVADLSLGFYAAVSILAFSTSIPIPLTFHCPGDRCPTVDISKALSKMCFLPALAEPFWLLAALSPMIRSFQDKRFFLSSLTHASAKQIWRWSIRVTQPLMSQINKDRKDGFAQVYYPRTIPPRNSSIVYVSRAINNAKEGNGKHPSPVG